MSSREGMRVEYLADREDLLAEVARLHFDEWGRLVPGQTLAGRTESLGRQCGRGEIPTVFVATKGERLLGTALLLDCDMSTRPELWPWLGGVVVKPEYRGHGVASSLVERVAAAAAASATELFLCALPALEPFYGRFGWRTIERCEFKGFDVVVMSRKLP